MSSKRKLFLHIGTNKTGTSSIQHHFFQNREKLAAFGFCYPAFGKNVAAHHELFDWVKQPQNNRRQLQALLNEMHPYENSVISSEALCDLKTPGTLKQLFADWDVKVVIYLRDPVRYLLSWWQQDIQMGDHYPDFNQYLVTKKRSYIELVDRWSDSFGKSNLIVRAYDREQMKRGDVVVDFKECIGLDPNQKMDRLPWENNPSISGNLLYFKLIFNSLRIPGASSQAMIDGLTDASKLRGEYRIVPRVPEVLANVTRFHYAPEIKHLKSEFGVRIPISSSIDGVRIPELSTIRRDFREVMEFSEEKGLPLAEMAKYVKF